MPRASLIMIMPNIFSFLIGWSLKEGKKRNSGFCNGWGKRCGLIHLFIILPLLRMPPHQNLQLDLQNPQAYASPLVSASSPRQSRTGPTSATCRSSTRFPTRSRNLSVRAARSPAQASAASWDSGKAHWHCSSQLEVRLFARILAAIALLFFFSFVNACSGFVNLIHLTWNRPAVPLLLSPPPPRQITV